MAALQQYKFKYFEQLEVHEQLQECQIQTCGDIASIHDTTKNMQNTK